MANYRLRNWFFTNVGDTKDPNGFWNKFVGGGISRPKQATFSDLADSVAFKTEDADRAKDVAYNTPHNANDPKQGLVVTALDADILDKTKAYTQKNVAKASQMTSAVSGAAQTVDSLGEGYAPTVNEALVVVELDNTITTRREYKFTLATNLVTWLNGLVDYIDNAVAGAGGETTTASNVGAGRKVYDETSTLPALKFKTLVAGNGVTLNDDGNEIEIISNSSSPVVNGEVIFNGTINQVCSRAGINSHTENLALKLIIFKQKEFYKFMISLNQTDVLSGSWAEYQTATDGMLYFKLTEYITSDISGVSLLHSDTVMIFNEDTYAYKQKAQLLYVGTGTKDLILAFNQDAVTRLLTGIIDRDITETQATDALQNTVLETNSMFTINAVIYENTVGSISVLSASDATGGDANISYTASGTYDVVYLEYIVSNKNWYSLPDITTVVLSTNPQVVNIGSGSWKLRARLYNTLYNTFSPYKESSVTIA